jgi:hypothetical protein
MKLIKSYKLFENSDIESIKSSIISNLSHVFDVLNDGGVNIKVFTRKEFLNPRIATTGNLVKCGNWCQFVIKYKIPTNHLRSGRRYNPVGATFDEVIKIQEYELEISKDIQEAISLSSDIFDIEGDSGFLYFEECTCKICSGKRSAILGILG